MWVTTDVGYDRRVSASILHWNLVPGTMRLAAHGERRLVEVKKNAARLDGTTGAKR